MKTWTITENNRKHISRIALCMGLVLLFCCLGFAPALAERLVLPQGLTVIEEEAFMGDTAITEIIISDGTTTIGNRAFSGCTGLAAITVPDSVVTIGEDVFDECEGVFINCSEDSVIAEYAEKNGIAYGEKINTDVPEGLEYEIFDTYAVVTWCEGNPKEIIIPDEIQGVPVTEIGEHAFSESTDLEKVSFPKYLERIGEYAFVECMDLKQVQFPESLKQIDRGAFYSTGLESVIIPDNVMEIEPWAFAHCYDMKSISVGKGVTVIEEFAFSHCVSVVDVLLPDGLKVIKNGAFQHCSSLHSIYLPDSITDLQGMVFWFCDELENINYPRSLETTGIYTSDDSWTTTNSPFYGCPKLTELTIPEGVTYIADSVFVGMSSLQKIHLPDSLEEIGWGAFRECINLKHIDIPSSVSYIQGLAFQGTGLTSIVLPDTLGVIWEGTFADCKDLRSVVLPEELWWIYQYAFRGCTSLEQINIPDSVSSIDGGAFYGCTALSSINYPIRWDDVYNDYSYEKGPFEGLNGIKHIAVPEGAECVPDYAFYGCAGLEDIYISSTVKRIGEFAFKGVSENFKIYGESGSYAETYANEQGIAFCAGKLPNQSEMEAATLYGKVQLSNGEPLAGAMIIAYKGNDHDIAGQAISGIDGKWSIEDLKVNTEYRIKCELAPFEFNSSSCYIHEKEQEVAAFIGMTEEKFVLTDIVSIRAENTEWTQEIQIQTQSDWKAEATADWIALSATEGSGNSVLTVSLSANPDEIRTGTIWVSTDAYMQDISVVQIGELSNRLGTPTITYPAEDGAVIPYGEIEVTWAPVNGAEHYVVSLRDLTTNDLLLNHSLTAQSDSMTALLSEAYFFPGNDYRVAVGAVPGGLSSDDPIVGWCEREFSIPQEEISDTSTIYGRVCAYEEANGIQEKMPVSNMIVSLYETQADEELKLISSVITNETGMWRFENCKPETRYSITVSQGVSLMNISVIDSSDDLSASASCNTVPGDNNMGDIIVVNGRIEVEQAKQGLFAEYFQYKKQSDVINDENKRYENIVSHIDFSWKAIEDSEIKVKSDDRSYSKLKASRYDGSNAEYGIVRYVKFKKFGALFNGYFVPSVTGQYQFRLTGDDGVKLTVGSMSDKDWGNGSSKKAIIGDKKKYPMNLAAGNAVRLEIEYYNDSGDANLKLEYQIAVDGKWTDEWHIVPPESLKRGSRQHHVSEDWFDVAEENAELDKKIKDFGKGKVGDIINDLIGGKVLKPVYDKFFKDSSSMTQWQYKIGINMKNIVGKSIISSVYKTIVGATISDEYELSDIGEQIVNGLIGKANLKLNDEKAIELKSLEWTDSADIFKNVVDIMAFVDECLPDSYDGLKNALNEILLYETNYVTGQVVGDSGMQAIAESVADEFGIIGSIIKTAVKAIEDTKKYNDSDLIRSYIYLAITEGKYDIQFLPEWIDSPLRNAGGSMSSYPDTGWSVITKENFDIKLSAAKNSTLVTAFHEEMKEIGNNMEVIVYKQLLIDTMGMMCDVYGDFD